MTTRRIVIGAVIGLALALTVGVAYAAGRASGPVTGPLAAQVSAQTSDRSDWWAGMEAMHDSAFMEQMRAQMGPEWAAQCDAMHSQMREHMGEVGGPMGPDMMGGHGQGGMMDSDDMMGPGGMMGS